MDAFCGSGDADKAPAPAPGRYSCLNNVPEERRNDGRHLLLRRNRLHCDDVADDDGAEEVHQNGVPADAGSVRDGAVSQDRADRPARRTPALR